MGRTDAVDVSSLHSAVLTVAVECGISNAQRLQPQDGCPDHVGPSAAAKGASLPAPITIDSFIPSPFGGAAYEAGVSGVGSRSPTAASDVPSTTLSMLTATSTRKLRTLLARSSRDGWTGRISASRLRASSPITQVALARPSGARCCPDAAVVFCAEVRSKSHSRRLLFQSQSYQS